MERCLNPEICLDLELWGPSWETRNLILRLTTMPTVFQKKTVLICRRSVIPGSRESGQYRYFSHHTRQQVPNDLPTHGQIVDSCKLRSQEYLDKINLWSDDQEMIVSEKKTKTMIVNFTDRYQFHTRLQLKSQNVEVVKKMKILGTIFTDRLSWNENCDTNVRKVNARMQLLRKIWSFGSPMENFLS